MTEEETHLRSHRVRVFLDAAKRQLEVEAETNAALDNLLACTTAGTRNEGESWEPFWIRFERNEIEICLRPPRHALRFNWASEEIFAEIRAALGCDRISSRGVSDPFASGGVETRYFATWVTKPA